MKPWQVSHEWCFIFFQARTEWIEQKEAAIQEAVGVAKHEWRQKHNEETKASVESAIKEQQEAWQKRCGLVN